MSGWPAALIALFSLLGKLVSWFRERRTGAAGSLSHRLRRVQQAREAAREAFLHKSAPVAGDPADGGMPDADGDTVAVRKRNDAYRRD